jgi:hypothetical protein
MSSDPLDALDHPEVAASLSSHASTLPTSPNAIEAYLESLALVAHRQPDQQPDPVAKELNASQFDAIHAISLESPADERAENFKTSGNEAYKLALATKEKLAKELDKSEEERDLEALEKLRTGVRKRYEDAFNYYCHGIESQPESRHLLSQLYSNKAQVQLALENVGHALKDCVTALSIDPHNSKAYWRASQACIKLARYKEALDYTRKAPNCKYIMKIELRSFAKLEQEILQLIQNQEEQTKKAAEEKAEQMKVLEEKKVEAEKRKKRISTAIANRGLLMGKPMFSDPTKAEFSVYGGLTNSLYAAQAELHDDHTLTWPVLILYPQTQQSDFIEHCHEHSRLFDHLALMFPPTGQKPNWDERNEFIMKNLRVYVEMDPEQAKNAKYRKKLEEEINKSNSLKSDEGKVLIPIDTSQTLASILASEPLRKRGYTIPAVPTFVVIANRAA